MAHSNQGGVKNYLGNQKMVKAPLHWQSAPNHPTTELAYITKKEKDLLIKKDLHRSLKGGVNRGPSGIMSLNGWGSTDAGQNVSGAAASAAESGRNTADTLAAGMSNQDVQDFQAASVAAGAGQRVNPGFFDSRNTVSPDVLARAKAFAPKAYGKHRGGIRDLITGGGFFGNLLRGVGQKFGWGKTYDQPTYDMSEFSRYGIGGTPPGTLDEDEDEKISEVSFSPIKTLNTNNMVAVPNADKTNFNQFTGEWMSDGGRAGYNRGRVVNPGGYQGDEEFEDENTLEFMQDQGIPYGPMAEASPFDLRIQELMGKGLSYEEAYDIAEMEFQNEFAAQEGESDQGIASLV